MTDDHFSYVALFQETDGSQLGTPTCEVCGPLGPTKYLDTDEAELRRIADEHQMFAPIAGLGETESQQPAD